VGAGRASARIRLPPRPSCVASRVQSISRHLPYRRRARAAPERVSSTGAVACTRVAEDAHVPRSSMPSSIRSPAGPPTRPGGSRPHGRPRTVSLILERSNASGDPRGWAPSVEAICAFVGPRRAHHRPRYPGIGTRRPATHRGTRASRRRSPATSRTCARRSSQVAPGLAGDPSGRRKTARHRPARVPISSTPRQPSRLRLATLVRATTPQLSFVSRDLAIHVIRVDWAGRVTLANGPPAARDASARAQPARRPLRPARAVRRGTAAACIASRHSPPAAASPPSGRCHRHAVRRPAPIASAALRGLPAALGLTEAAWP
jgi:hypothetical protein